MDRLNTITQLKDWIPVRLYRRGGEPTIDWCYFGARTFDDPFFSQTVERCMRSPSNLLFRHQTPIEILEEFNANFPGVPAAGFIFHVSRCGSTLVSQVLSSLLQNIVISEAPVIDSAITGRKVNAEVHDEQKTVWLQGILNALGQRRTGSEQRMFVKFDAWNIIDLPVVRRAFPDVPWIFLYRDPVEVLVSQLSHRGAHMVPGVIDPRLFGLAPEEVTNMLPADYCAAVLACLYKAGLNYHTQGGRLMNYTELPGAVFSLGSFFGVDWTGDELNTMREKCKLDAKNPYQTFEDDRQRKQRDATDQIVEAARTWLYPVYEQLEFKRTSAVDVVM